MLKEHRDKINPEDAKTVEEALEETKTKISSGASAEEINASTDKLTSASHKLAEAMYKSTGTPGSGPTPGADGGGQSAGNQQEKPKDNVVDAEFVDVEDKK
jgi:molecular chaperone DnaK